MSDDGKSWVAGGTAVTLFIAAGFAVAVAVAVAVALLAWLFRG